MGNKYVIEETPEGHNIYLSSINIAGYNSRYKPQVGEQWIYGYKLHGDSAGLSRPEIIMQLNNSRRENDLSEEHKIVRLPVRTFLKILFTFPQGTKPEVKGGCVLNVLIEEILWKFNSGD